MNYYFITGTSSGIGKALVEELLRYPNHQIVGLSRTNKLHEDQFKHLALDLSKVDDVYNFDFDELADAKKIVLINNAGTLGEMALVGKQRDENVQESIQVNFTSAAILMNKFVAKYQERACEKLIINISSGAALSPYDSWSNYCSAKAALNMFTEVVHKEQKALKHPVKAFAIAPGVVDTLMQDTIRSYSVEEFSQVEKFINLKKENQLYKAKDVAKRLVEMINEPDLIPTVISRISLS